MAVIDSFCAKDTYELGEKIGQMAKPGMVISLTGDLGEIGRASCRERV